MIDTVDRGQRAQTQSRAARKRTPKPLDLGELIGRLAFSVPEFASLFGRSATWGYRAVYRGLVQPINEGNRLLIPRSQVDALLAKTQQYNPESKPKADGDGKGGET